MSIAPAVENPVPPTLLTERPPGSSVPALRVRLDREPRHDDQDLIFPLPETSLDPRETSRGSIHRPSVDDQDDDFETDAGLRFRHSFWSHRRPLARAALIHAGAGPHRVEAWDRCGTCAWVLVHPDHPNEARIACRCCHDRWCEACAVEKRRRVSRNLLEALMTRYKLKRPSDQVGCLRFLTLTLKSTDRPLAEQVDRLYAGFGNLRRRKAIAKCFHGGIAFLELTVNPRTSLWHPHLHVLFEGQFLPQKQVSELWLDITGDSYIVDVRQIRSVGVAAGYVTKYASKAVSATVVHSPTHFAEAVTALAGKRVFNTFGTWTALGLTDQPAPEAGWTAIGTLQAVIDRASNGDAAAREVLAALRSSSAPEPLPVVDAPGPAP